METKASTRRKGKSTTQKMPVGQREQCRLVRLPMMAASVKRLSISLVRGRQTAGQHDRHGPGRFVQVPHLT